MISQEDKQKVIQELNKKLGPSGAKCPMCGNKHFIIADGYFNTFVQDDLNDINLGGPSIPSISIICSNCGFMSQHALGVLGLLPKQNSDEKEGGNNGK